MQPHLLRTELPWTEDEEGSIWAKKFILRSSRTSCGKYDEFKDIFALNESEVILGRLTPSGTHSTPLGLLNAADRGTEELQNDRIIEPFNSP